MAVQVYQNALDGVPRVWPTGDTHCDGCPTGLAKVKLVAKAGEGYTARTMRLCYKCAGEMRVEMNVKL